MAIWQRKFTIQQLNDNGQNTMSSLLGIEFTVAGDDYLSARMPVNDHTKQPAGIMHGGASCTLAETVGSVGAFLCLKNENQYCVGLDINTNHLRAMREGFVTGTAKPFHLGQSTQVWGIEIKNETGQLVSVTRLTMAVLTRS